MNGNYAHPTRTTRPILECASWFPVKHRDCRAPGDTDPERTMRARMLVPPRPQTVEKNAVPDEPP
ncbi:hypothetical protein ACWIGI_03830, partial [Nocardia sp. NPDC055321]